MSRPDSTFEAIPPARRPFTRVEPWVIRYGLLASLSGSEAKVLLTLCFKADNITATACVKVADLARLAGVSRSSIPSITENLEIAGVIMARRVGNRQIYKLLTEPPEWVKQRGFVGKRKAFRPTAFNGTAGGAVDFDPVALERTQATTTALAS